MRKFRNIALALVLITSVIAMSGCATYDNFKEAFFSEKGAASDSIKIGVLEPQTGNDSSKGELEIQGIELAHQLAGEVLGKKVELVYADTQSSMYVAETAVKDLIDKKPVAVLGPYGEVESLTASTYLGKAKIPAVAITSANPLITLNNEYYFRVGFTESSQGKALAEYAYKALNSSDAIIVRTKNEDTTNDLINKFTKKLQQFTDDEECIKDTIEMDPDAKAYDYVDYALQIKETGSKVVFMPVSIGQAEKLFKELQKLSTVGVTFIGPKEWYNEQLIDLQNKYPGIRIAVASDFSNNMADTKYYDAFVKAFEEKYPGSEPTEAAALGFDAYMITVQAITKANSIDGFLVKNAMAQTKYFPGASGEISFDESGEPKKSINIDVIYKNQFRTVYTVTN